MSWDNRANRLNWGVSSMNKIKPWQKALAGALLAAGLVSACGGAPAAESTPAPSYPDNSTTNDYEADTTDYYDDEDYDLEESAYYATPNLEVGATLTAEEAEATREALRGMDNEERAGRVVVNRDGVYVVADVHSLNSGDVVDDEAAIEVLSNPVFLPILVVNGQNVIYNQRDGMPEFMARARATAFASGTSPNIPQFQLPDEVGVEWRASRSQQEIADFLARVQADADTPMSEIPNEFALVEVSSRNQGFAQSQGVGTTDTARQYQLVNLGGGMAFGGRSINEVVDMTRTWDNPEAARAEAQRLVNQFPGLIFHDFS